MGVRVAQPPPAWQSPRTNDEGDAAHAFREHTPPIVRVEVLKPYSHTRDMLTDLRKAREVVYRQVSAEPREQPPRPLSGPVANRLSPEDVQAIIERYHSGTIAKDLAATFGMSTKSIYRLLRKHDARRCDRSQ
jgi:hypothetical protein